MTEGRRMKLRPDETDPEAERALIEMLRRTPTWKRAEQWNALTMARRERILDDVRERHPQADEQELRKRFAARVLPREILIRMFGWNPEKEDD
jgi:hypothetical protein